MRRPPTRPPLFPYTTLFRSPALQGRRGHELGRPGGAVDHFVGGRQPAIAAELLIGGAEGGEAAPADRKSTRLNSSHPSISYAVFCLKKKTLRVRPFRYPRSD